MALISTSPWADLGHFHLEQAPQHVRVRARDDDHRPARRLAHFEHVDPDAVAHPEALRPGSAGCAAGWPRPGPSPTVTAWGVIECTVPCTMSPSRSMNSSYWASRSASRSRCRMTCLAVCAATRPKSSGVEFDHDHVAQLGLGSTRRCASSRLASVCGFWTPSTTSFSAKTCTSPGLGVDAGLDALGRGGVDRPAGRRTPWPPPAPP